MKTILAILLLASSCFASDYVIYGTGYTNTFTSANDFTNQFAATIPSGAPANDVYVIWPTNANGAGEAIILNKAEAWWVGPDTVSVGETFSVYGRSLALNGTGYVWCAEAPTTNWMTSTAANPYKADFVVPGDWTNGTYTIYSHNGKGGKYGWSDALTLTVTNEFMFTGTVFNVTDIAYGADPADDDGDDATAIQNAINAAKATPGSQVYFPAGTYALGKSIHDATNIKIYGDSATNTFITYASNYGYDAGYNYGMFYSFSGPLTIEDISFVDNEYDTGNNSFIQCVSKAGPFHFNRLTFDQSGLTTNFSYPINMNKASDVRLTDCSFIQGLSIDVSECDYVNINGCDFYGIWDCNYMVQISSTKGLSITGCTAQNYDNTNFVHTNAAGWGEGRFVFGGNDIQNFYYGNNETINLMKRNDGGNGNTGEQLMFEYCPTQFEDSPSSVSGLTNVSFSSLATDYTGQSVAIMSGRGLGQTRVISAYSEGTITVDPPWRVAPNTGSVLHIGLYENKFAIYDNIFDGYVYGVTNDWSGQAGVEPFGSAHNFVIDGNTFKDLRFGIRPWSMSDTAGGGIYRNAQNFFLDIQNNTFTNCRYAITQSYDTWNNSPNPTSATITHLGNTYRRNTFYNIVEGILYFDNDDNNGVWSTQNLTVFDGNTINGFGSLLDYTPDDGSIESNVIFSANTTNGAAWNP